MRNCECVAGFSKDSFEIPLMAPSGKWKNCNDFTNRFFTYLLFVELRH